MNSSLFLLRIFPCGLIALVFFFKILPRSTSIYQLHSPWLYFILSTPTFTPWSIFYYSTGQALPPAYRQAGIERGRGIGEEISNIFGKVFTHEYTLYSDQDQMKDGG